MIAEGVDRISFMVLVSGQEDGIGSFMATTRDSKGCFPSCFVKGQVNCPDVVTYNGKDKAVKTCRCQHLLILL